jgi:hypothetical protein
MSIMLNVKKRFRTVVFPACAIIVLPLITFSEELQTEEMQSQETKTENAAPKEATDEDVQLEEEAQTEEIASEVTQPEGVMPENSQLVETKKPEDVQSEETEPDPTQPEEIQQEKAASMAILPIRNSQGIITPETKEILTWIHFKLFSMNVKNMLKQEELEGKLSSDASINLDSCYSEECMFSAGSKLQVKSIVFGTMDTRDSTRTLSLSLGNIPTMKVINKVTIETKGSILDLMNQLSLLLTGLLAYGIDTSQTIIPEPEPPAPQYAILELGSEPEGADVLIDGDKVGTTPYRNDSLKEGTHEVIIDMYSYKQFKKDISLSKGDHRKLKIHLIERFGGLTVLSKPQGATVVLNNDTTGQTPFSSDTIIPGNYNLGLYLQEYVPFTKAISVIRGQADTITTTLVSKAFVDSMARVKKNRWRWIRRITFGTLTAGFTGLGYYTNELVKNSLVNEDNAYKSYMAQKDAALQQSKWEEYNEIADHTDKLMKERNAWYIMGGLFAIGFGLSIPF